MTTERNTKPSNNKLKLRSFGQLVASAEPLRGLAEATQAQIAAGASDDELQAFVLREGNRLGVCGPRALLPSLTRKVLRVPLRDALREIAEYLSERAGKKRVGDWVNSLLNAVGFDAWFCDYIINWARTGEPGPYFDAFIGKSFSMQITQGGDKTPVVVAVATPYCDPHEITHDFIEECVRVFPDATWDRMGINVEAARCVRLRIDGLTDYQIAEILLDENEPGWRIVYEDKSEWRARRKTEAKRVQKLRQRFWRDYGDSIVAFVSPDSD